MSNRRERKQYSQAAASLSIDPAALLRNQFALLLAAARPHLTPPEFLRRLRLQQRGDLRLARGRTVAPGAPLPELEQAIRDVLKDLDKGEFPRPAFLRACALYERSFPGDSEGGAKD